MNNSLIVVAFWVFASFSPVSAFAQGTSVGFGTSAQQTDAPLEITADSLSVDQSSGRASFQGNVLIAQGDLRLSADAVSVKYGQDGTGIEQLLASGNVVLVSGDDAAEAENAAYKVETGEIIMTGDVLMTQGASVLNSERMTIDLQGNSARLEGRVRTVLKPAPRD